MSDQGGKSDIPAMVAGIVEGITQPLIPSFVKALDRLVGATVDIPVAKLNQYKARIDAETQSFVLVEKAIARAAAGEAKLDHAIVDRAIEVLVRKEYRKQTNREAVASAMIDDFNTRRVVMLPDSKVEVLDDDWLNVFERFSEDASSERMQRLWGRVLAGEIRKPGQYSARTLRFLSEFSQRDAILFEEFCQSNFGGITPKRNGVQAALKADATPLLHLEAIGLIHGVTSDDLEILYSFDETREVQTDEAGFQVTFVGETGVEFSSKAMILTPLGRELITLLPGRDPREAARKFARATRVSEISAAYLTIGPKSETNEPIEILWEGRLQTKRKRRSAGENDLK